MGNTPVRASLTAVVTLAILFGVSCSTEKADWEAAGKDPSELSYLSFLEKHPGGRFASAAKEEIAEFQAWKEASEIGSVDSLEGYIKAHAQGRHADEARARVESFFASRPADLRAIRTIGLTRRQTFNEDVKDATIDFEGVLAGLFPYFGLRKAGPGEPKDAIIRIECQANAFGASYSSYGYGSGTFYYTGASVSGSAALELSGRKPWRENFAGSVPVPYSLSGYGGAARVASGAPFDEAMRNGFPKKAAGLLARAFGYAPLIAGLGSVNPAISQASADALAASGEAAFALLLGALDSPQMAIRRGAAVALRGHKTAASIAALVRVIGKAAGGPDDLRAIAEGSLSAMGASALPALEEASKDADPVVRRSVAKALGGIRVEGSRTILVRLVDDAEVSVREAAFEAFGEHRSRAAAVVLIDRLPGAAENMRPVILSAIERSTSPDVVIADGEGSHVSSLVWDADLAERLVKTAQAIAGSAAAGNKFTGLVSGIGDLAVEPILGFLRNENPKLRAWAAEVLGKIVRKEAILPLAKLIADPDRDVRLAVAKSLSMYSAAGAIEPLSGLLLDSDPGIRGQAIRGLKNVVDTTESSAELRRCLSSAPAIRVLAEALAASRPDGAEDRDAAAAVLGAIGRPAVESLSAILKGSNPFAREGAVAALGETGDDGAVAALLAYGKDPAVQKSDDGMAQLYRALGASRNIKALEFLAEGLKGAPGGHMSQAVEALRALGSVRAVDALVAALTPEIESYVYSQIDSVLRELTHTYPESEGKFDWKTWWTNNRKNYGLK